MISFSVLKWGWQWPWSALRDSLLGGTLVQRLRRFLVFCEKAIFWRICHWKAFSNACAQLRKGTRQHNKLYFSRFAGILSAFVRFSLIYALFEQHNLYKICSNIGDSILWTSWEVFFVLLWPTCPFSIPLSCSWTTCKVQHMGSIRTKGLTSICAPPAQAFAAATVNSISNPVIFQRKFATATWVAEFFRNSLDLATILIERVLLCVVAGLYPFWPMQDGRFRLPW